MYQRETENQSWHLPVHVLFLITVEVSIVCLWTSKDVACYNCRHLFYDGVWGRKSSKIKCVYNTFSDCMYTSRKRFVCTNPLWDSSVCTNPLLAIFKTLKMAKNHRFWRKWHFYDFCVFLLCQNFIFKVHFKLKNVDLKNHFCIY